MIDRLISKTKLRRGTESQRIQVVLDDSELIYTTDTNSLYIGDGFTLGGKSVANSCYTITQITSGVPPFAKKGDIIHTTNDTYTYIVDVSGSNNLFLRPIASGAGGNTTNITGDQIGIASISAFHLSHNVVKLSGGIGLDPLSGLYIQYDPLTLTIINGLLTVLPLDASGGPIYTFDTNTGGLKNLNNVISVNVDDVTVKVIDHKLTVTGLSGLSGLREYVDNRFNALTGSGMPSGIVKSFGIQHQTVFSMGCIISRDNNVYVWGRLDGKHSDETDRDLPPTLMGKCRFWDTNNTDYFYNNPTVIVSKLIFGRTQMLALLSDGTVWTNGTNRVNKASSATTTDYTYGFVKKDFSGVLIREISLNQGTYTGSDTQECFAAISTTNSLYVWGYNDHGQLGLGDKVDRYTPVKVTSNGLESNVNKVLMSGAFNPCTQIITLSGDLYVAGENSKYQLGQGTNIDPLTFVKARISTGIALSGVSDFAVSGFGQNQSLFVLKTDGTIWGCGNNGDYQLGDGTNIQTKYFKRITSLTGISKIAQGPPETQTMIAMTSAGDVYTWGYNAQGQCGDGSTVVRKSPYLVTTGATDIFISTTYRYGVTGFIKNKHLYMSGFRAYTTPNIADTQTTHYPVHVNNVKDVLFAGSDESYHTGVVILTEDGHLHGHGISQHYLFTSTPDIKTSSTLILI